MSHSVTWLLEYPTLNGGERSLLAQLPELRAAGFRIAAIAPPRGPLADALQAADVVLLPFEFRAGAARRPLEQLRTELRFLLTAQRPDLLHANSLSMGRLCGPVAEELQLPSIAHLRDIVGLSAAAVADLAKNGRLLAVSEATRAFHIAQSLPADKIHVLHNGVDLALFAPRPASGRLHRELNLPVEAQLIGTIGQLVIRKGQDVLAAAAAQIVERCPAAHFVLVGERSSEKDEAVRYEAALRAAFSAGPLAGRGHFLGRRCDVDRILPELTLLAHPARQEPLGRVLLEAAACGIAIVATDVGGTREVFPNADSALLVPPGDAAALAEAVVDSLQSRDRRAALGRAARRRAEEAFDLRLAAAGTIDQYRQAIAPHQD